MQAYRSAEYKRKRNAEAKELRDYRRSKHLCTSCGMADDLTRSGKSYCAACLVRAKVYRDKYTNTDGHKEYDRRRHRRQYHDRKDKGLCAYCGKREPIEGRIWCEECAKKNHYYRHNYYNKNSEKILAKNRERHARKKEKENGI